MSSGGWSKCSVLIELQDQPVRFCLQALHGGYTSVYITCSLPNTPRHSLCSQALLWYLLIPQISYIFSPLLNLCTHSVLWSRMCSPSTTIPYSFHVVSMCSSLRCQHRCHFLWKAVIIPLNLSLMSFLFKRLLTCLSLPSNYKLLQGGGSLLFITVSQGLSTMSGVSVV